MFWLGAEGEPVRREFNYQPLMPHLETVVSSWEESGRIELLRIGLIGFPAGIYRSALEP
jgi:hypothetical protein